MTDTLGYAAALAVFATFLMQSMVSLRVVAILSNILFLLYGYSTHIYPIVMLHAALLPINITRLVGCKHGGSLKWSERKIRIWLLNAMVRRSAR